MNDDCGGEKITEKALVTRQSAPLNSPKIPKKSTIASLQKMSTLAKTQESILAQPKKCLCVSEGGCQTYFSKTIAESPFSTEAKAALSKKSISLVDQFSSKIRNVDDTDIYLQKRSSCGVGTDQPEKGDNAEETYDNCISPAELRALSPRIEQLCKKKAQLGFKRKKSPNSCPSFLSHRKNLLRFNDLDRKMDFATVFRKY